jgi:hypothetical protein
MQFKAITSSLTHRTRQALLEHAAHPLLEAKVYLFVRIILGSQKMSWHLEQDHSRRYPMACKEEVVQVLQQLQELTIDMGHKENNLVTNALQQLGLTVETAGLVNVVTGDNWETQTDEQADCMESLVDVDLADSRQTQATGARLAKQPSGRWRTTVDREVASTITLPGNQQIVTRAQCMEWEACAEEACLVEHQCLEWQVRKKARKAEKCHRKKDCRRQQQIAEQNHDGQAPTLGDCIQGLLEIVAPSPTNQETQEESQSLPSSGSNTTGIKWRQWQWWDPVSGVP